MKGYLYNVDKKRLIIMVIGNVFLGMGISIFKLSGMGNDPFSGMVMALAECVGITYANFLILLSHGIVCNRIHHRTKVYWSRDFCKRNLFGVYRYVLS